MIKFVKNDGGRVASGFTGKAGDCVVRPISTATELLTISNDADPTWINATMPKTKGRKTAGIHSAANGIYTESVHFKRYMVQLGFMWVPTMTVGSGCLVHLRAVELPKGRTITRD